MAGRDQPVKVAIFSAKKYDREFLSPAHASLHELTFFESHFEWRKRAPRYGIPSRVCGRSSRRPFRITTTVLPS
jgi:hypothetical protein